MSQSANIYDSAKSFEKGTQSTLSLLLSASFPHALPFGFAQGKLITFHARRTTHDARRSTFHVLRFTFYVLILLLLVFASSSFADTQSDYLIRQIVFEGNEHLERKHLAQLMGVQAGQPYRKAEIVSGLNRIIAEYSKNGFVFASIEPEVALISSEQVHIRVRIHEGRQIRTGQITIEGNHLFSTQELQRELGLREGMPFSQIALERGIDRALTLYSEYGYPTVSISPTDFHLTPDPGKLDFQLQISEGNQARIGEVKVSGLKKTKAETILRELPIQPGQVFNQRKIDQSYHRLMNLGYFYEVSPALLEEGNAPDEINFNARVTEARTGRFSGVLGYAPPTSEFDNAPRLTGLIEASETNLLGTGRQAILHWKSGLLSTLRMGYVEPWAFGKSVKIGIEYSQLKQKNQFTDAESAEKSGSLSIGTRFRSLLEASLAVSYKQINLSGIDASFIPTNPADAFSRLERPPVRTPVEQSEILSGQKAQNGVKYGMTFSLTRDSRDYFLNPTRGRRDHVAFEFSRGDFKLRKLWLDLQQYFPTWRNQVIAIGLHGAVAWGDNIPPTELFYLGGANTLRGYNEDWFFGPRRFYTNVEYRLLVGRTSQLFAFVDLGAVTKVAEPTRWDALHVGYGFGMRLESKGGILNMDYGLAEGGSALQGKIHVNLGTSF